jgi:hypothetical protein
VSGARKEEEKDANTFGVRKGIINTTIKKKTIICEPFFMVDFFLFVT